MSVPVDGLENVDAVETWDVDSPQAATHFGLPWNGVGYHLLLLNHRLNGGHMTFVIDVAAETVEPRPGWPTDWPEHNESNCAGHGNN